jgi:hypothetical protein
LTINDDHKIFYENICEGDETIVLAWCSIIRVGHFH